MSNENAHMRKRLRLKPVDMEYLEQYDELLRYVFQVTQDDLTQSGYEEGEITRSKRPILAHSDVIGWFNGEKLVSQLSVYPCKVNVHGRIYPMGGLTGVGTYPEYSSMGLMNDLIRVALERMRARRQWISYLYPYSVPYYRNKGWEVLNDRITYTIKDTQLPNFGGVKGFVERMSIDDEDVYKVYDRYARRKHGALIRDARAWEEYWRWENEDDRSAAIYYDGQHRPKGLLFYWIAEDVFHVKDMVYLNQEARKGLWNFITAHFSMIDRAEGWVHQHDPQGFWLEDSQIVERIEPYFMARIVDVEGFLSRYPFEERCEPFHFVVKDPIAKWNNGCFSVNWSEEGKLRISREKLGPAVRLSIQTLAALLMSYRRPGYFAEIQRLKTDQNTLHVLEDIIPEEQPYFSDYF